ncbi:MAG TPA: hypothetical protein VKW77_07960 [Acidimicrobiales bacterium]|nr:hypothetical protein [Acidimicrobiales bacterium]
MLSLLEEAGSVQAHDGRYKVTVAGETRTFEPPRRRHHDVDIQTVVDLRRMRQGAGITPD